MFSRDISFDSSEMSIDYFKKSKTSNKNKVYNEDPNTTILNKSSLNSELNDSLINFNNKNLVSSKKLNFFSEKKNYFIEEKKKKKEKIRIKLEDKQKLNFLLKKTAKKQKINKNKKFEKTKIPKNYLKTNKNKKIAKKKKPKKKTTICNCKKNNCLKLYCSCFKNLGVCSDICKCENCLNSEKFKTARDFVIKKTKIISKMAFDKFFIYKNKKILRNGCNCKKGCKNGYCECQKNGAFCSTICNCCDFCENLKVFVEKRDVREIFVFCPRKKKRIVVSLGGIERKIVFDNY